MFDKLNLYKPIYYVLIAAGAIMAGWACAVDLHLGIGLALVWLAAVIYALLESQRVSRNNRRYMQALRESLFGAQREAMLAFPMPTLLTSESGEILWSNDACQQQVLGGTDRFGENIFPMLQDFEMERAGAPEGQSITVGGRMFTVYAARARRDAQPVYVFYFIDDHDLKSYAREYFDSRPSVLLMMIDNYSELFQEAKENERSKVMGEVEHVLETFAEQNKGMLKKLDKDLYVAVLEDRYMRAIISGRFEILDQIRQISTGDRLCPTLSIGVGYREGSIHASEELARQALDMALGRGGDQAALKVKDGYEFYGGLSKGVEKRNKVRTRIVANAISEIVESSGTILVMGHRFADLDCIGAAAGLCAGLRGMGKDPHMVVDESRCLAENLCGRLREHEMGDMILSPEAAAELVSENTLLFVVDTHVKSLLESPEIYARCKNVVVIDHHRKMVDHIDNAIIFYHEPYSSSACELIAELLQYMGDRQRLPVSVAEAMLSGIMLDTKNFTMRTGVRTFEAAAYLRRMGADTTEVRRLFASTMERYQQKIRLISSAEEYKHCAIAHTSAELPEIRVLASQAADELLNISDVAASFILFPENGGVSVSARSLGQMNVQIVMEELGGGGHQTMAAAQLPVASMEIARQQLLDAIDRYYVNNKDKGEKSL